MRLIQYHRVSTEEQAESGLGLAAQRRATTGYLEAFAFKGWESVGVLEDEGISTRLPLDKRPAMAETMALIRAGEADGLIAMKMDRISRSVVEWEALMAESNNPKTGGFTLVAMDVGVDTSTATGKMAARLIAVIAEWERDIISERTRAALAERAAQGVKLGRPRRIPGSIRDRVWELRSGELSYRAIAQRLTDDGVPTISGNPWSHSTVASLLSSR